MSSYLPPPYPGTTSSSASSSGGSSASTNSGPPPPKKPPSRGAVVMTPPHFGGEERCSVALVGDSKVGKTSLWQKALKERQTEGNNHQQQGRLGGLNYHQAHISQADLPPVNHPKQSGTSSPHALSLRIGGKIVRFTILDTNGSKTIEIPSVNLVLLCFKISDPSTLASALSFWTPLIRSRAPLTPIILVGCQADKRHDRDVISSLSRAGQAPISADQALTVSRRAGCVSYVETSAAKSSAGFSSSATAAFEAAGFWHCAKFTDPKITSRFLAPQETPSTPNQKRYPPHMRLHSPSPLAGIYRRSMSHTALANQNLYSPEPLKKAHLLSTSSHHLNNNNLLSSGKLSVRTKSHQGRSKLLASSWLSLNNNGSSTPGSPRLGHSRKFFGNLFGGSRKDLSSENNNFKGSQSKDLNHHHIDSNNSSSGDTVAIKCQRLNAESKQYEEVEVRVPRPIFDTLKLYNGENEDEEQVERKAENFRPSSTFEGEEKINTTTRGGKSPNLHNEGFVPQNFRHQPSLNKGSTSRIGTKIRRALFNHTKTEKPRETENDSSTIQNNSYYENLSPNLKVS